MDGTHEGPDASLPAPAGRGRATSRALLTGPALLLMALVATLPGAARAAAATDDAAAGETAAAPDDAAASTDTATTDTATTATETAATVAAASKGGGGGAALSSPMVSGLSWRSGAKVGACFPSLRGRRLDVNHIFITHKSFKEMVRQSGGGWAQNADKEAPLVVVSLPLLTDDTKGQFAKCATGAFDASWKQIGANIKRIGAAGTVVRLGWEANIGSDSHPWGVDGPSEVAAYKACWRRAAQAIKAGGPGLNLEWTSAKRTMNKSLSVLSMYPGDDVVDLWGVHYYDSGPRKNTQGIWNQYVDAKWNGAPWGIKAWLDAARAHGKKLGVGEWGVWQDPREQASKADDPVYIQNMYQFFKANASGIAYEAYLNSRTEHALCPNTRFPRAAAQYKASWGSGR